jgi:D-methionine transport system permease protein
MFELILTATWETLLMVVVSGLLAVFIGLPLGVLLLTTRKDGILAAPLFNKGLGLIINILRSIPFIILIVALIPLTRWVMGSSIGTIAAIMPLTIGAIPFVARMVENALVEVSGGLIEAGHAMGASPWQIIAKILIPEARPGIINGITVMLVTLVGYSAMAGAVGGGGLGNLAINYGYLRFNTTIMIITIVVLLLLVQIIQYIGDWLSRRWNHSI